MSQAVAQWQKCKRGTRTTNSFTGGQVKNIEVKTVTGICKIRLSSEKCHWLTKDIDEDQVSGNNIPSKFKNN